MKLSKVEKEAIDAFSALFISLETDMKRLETLRKVVADLADRDESGEAITLQGNKHRVEYTKRVTESVPLLTPQEFIKKTKAWDCLSISVTAVRKGAIKFDEVFTEKLGKRRIKGVR